MAIRANVDLAKAHPLIERRIAAQQNVFLGSMVIVHPNTDPALKMQLASMAIEVRENPKVREGGAFMETVPEFLLDAVIEW